MYKPRLNDYVSWTKGVEGWVYFVCKDYVTIETHVCPKDKQNIEACALHKNTRVLVLCYPEQWSELQHIGYRLNKYSEEIVQVSEL